MAKAMARDSFMTIDEPKDFGDVGCYTGKVTAPVTEPGFGKPVHTTTCFMVRGGYLLLTLGSEDPSHVSFDAVKRFLEKAAARRRR
jgi:hypothetical protein